MIDQIRFLKNGLNQQEFSSYIKQLYLLSTLIAYRTIMALIFIVRRI